jgi:hypothetical protein
MVSLTKAVELMAQSGDVVSLATLSRYVRNHADALTPTVDGRRLLVDYEALVQHRSENIRLDLRQPAGAPKPSAETDPFSAGTRADEAALNTRAQRRLRELELAKAEGDLMPRLEAEEAAMDAVSAMKNAMALALADTSEQLAATTGVEARIIRPHLRAFERKAFEAFCRTLIDHGLVADGSVAPE